MFTPENRAKFLAALADTANVTHACRVIDYSRVAVYNFRKEDVDFARQWDDALSLGMKALEDEAMRRAQLGVDEPVFYEGREIAKVKKYSDTLMIFLLKAHNPDKYRDKTSVELTGKNGGPVETKHTTLSDDELDARILELSAKAGAARASSES